MFHARRRWWRHPAQICHESWEGYATYDAFILRSAVAGGADRILTLNRRQFERLAPREIEVVTP